MHTAHACTKRPSSPEHRQMGTHCLAAELTNNQAVLPLWATLLYLHALPCYACILYQVLYPHALRLLLPRKQHRGRKYIWRIDALCGCCCRRCYCWRHGHVSRLAIAARSANSLHRVAAALHFMLTASNTLWHYYPRYALRIAPRITLRIKRIRLKCIEAITLHVEHLMNR